MRLVIDVPDRFKNMILYNIGAPSTPDVQELSVCVLKGTPLPKNHGNLVDVDELLSKEKPVGISDMLWRESHTYKMLANAPIIIEADKENKC